MKLHDALSSRIGRGTFLTVEAEEQLLPESGSLASQAAALAAATAQAIPAQFGRAAEVPLPSPQPWTLLTEGEHAGWGLLALSDPPALSGAEVARLTTHLAQARQTLSPAERRQLARKPGRPQSETWAEWLAAYAVTHAHAVLLGYWGVLSVSVGLNAEHQSRAAQLLSAELLRRPAELTAPKPLGLAALWATLWPLHGGLPLPDEAGVLRLAYSLRGLRPVHTPMPDEAGLAQTLLAHLPQLPPEQAGLIAAQMHGKPPPFSADPTAGICISLAPGETAYWLRRPREVQLIACLGEDAQVRQWIWRK